MVVDVEVAREGMVMRSDGGDGGGGGGGDGGGGGGKMRGWDRSVCSECGVWVVRRMLTSLSILLATRLRQREAEGGRGVAEGSGEGVRW